MKDTCWQTQNNQYFRARQPRQAYSPLPVPNVILAELSRHDPMRAVGEASDRNNAILSMYLPDMCGELVSSRAELEILREEVRAQRARKQGFAASPTPAA